MESPLILFTKFSSKHFDKVSHQITKNVFRFRSLKFIYSEKATKYMNFNSFSLESTFSPGLGLKIESRVSIYAQWDFHEKQPETISVSFKRCLSKHF